MALLVEEINQRSESMGASPAELQREHVAGAANAPTDEAAVAVDPWRGEDGAVKPHEHSSGVPVKDPPGLEVGDCSTPAARQP